MTPELPHLMKIVGSKNWKKTGRFWDESQKGNIVMIIAVFDKVTNIKVNSCGQRQK